MSDGAWKIQELASEGLPARAAELRQLFPEAMTDGKLDIEKLKLLLGEAVDESPERYGLTWPGKRDAIRLAQKQSTATLNPVPVESVDFDTTKNVIIEGDNLEVLKLLQKSYYGRVKLIYIDPPYNTGNDFVYADDFEEPLNAYLRRSGQVDGDSLRTSANREASGRFHSDWLSMMYPRLVIARKMLSDEGIVFVSIDESELSRLRLLMDEIFEEGNFVAELVWNQSSGAQAGHFTGSHEYIVCFAKNKSKLPQFRDRTGGSIIHGALKKISKANPSSEVTFPAGSIRFEGEDATFRGVIGGSEKTFIKSESLTFKDGVLAETAILEAGWAMKNQLESWLRGEETFDSKGQRVLRFYFNRQGVLFYEKERGTVHPKTVLQSSEVGGTKAGGQDVALLLGEGNFSFPKPVDLIKFIVELVTRDDDLVLDFFAGSGTTAHAVMAVNVEDGGNRRFILVQLPEETDNAEYPTISDITRERVRRAGQKIKKESGEKGANLDVGFRAFRLAESNFRNWDSDTDTFLSEELDFYVDNVNSGASDDDVVHEILLKAGVPLDVDLKRIQIAGENVYVAMEGLFVTSAARKISQELVDGILALEPWPVQVVLLDAGFGDNDSLKLNARHQFASRRPESDPDKDNALRTV